MNKEIYFCVDAEARSNILKSCGSTFWDCCTYLDTENAIKERLDIVTTSIAHLSFDLLNNYDIYLCYKDKRVKIEPHMDLSGIGEPCKDLRFAHNIFKLFRAGIFNDLLGIEKEGKDV